MIFFLLLSSFSSPPSFYCTQSSQSHYSAALLFDSSQLELGDKNEIRIDKFVPCVCVCVPKPVRPGLYLEHITEQVVSFFFSAQLYTVNRISSRVSGKHVCTSDSGSCAFLLFLFFRHSPKSGDAP